MLSPLDYVLLHLGNPGRYQIFVAFLLCCLQFPVSFTGQLWKYYAEEPPHRCLLKYSSTNKLMNGLNVSASESEWFPLNKQENRVKTFESCIMFIDAYNHWKGTQKCPYGWEYRPPENEHNLVIEYDLVCERKYLLTSFFYLYHTTAIFGAIIFGMIADRCERKRTLLLSLYLFVSASFSVHFVTDYLQFVILFSLQTFFAAGLQITSFVLLLELFPTPYQLRASLYSVSFNISATMFLPLLMWAIRNWRYVQLAISAPCIVFFAHIWLLPQSPLWLVVEGKLHSAENLIEKLAHQNGKTVPPSFRLHLQNLYSTVKSCGNSQTMRHRILPKFSSAGLRWYMFVHFYLFFVVALTSDVTESQTIKLNENRYADHFYRGLMDLGSIMLVYHFAVRLGPRSVQALIFILSGLLLMGSITLQEMLPKSYDINVPKDFDFRLLLLPSTLILIARTLIVTLPAFIWFHAAKTLPTGIRVIGFAACFSWSQIGQMAAPHLLVLAELIAPFIPIGLCGSLSVVAGGLSLLFPTCYRKPLPNTIEEAENKRLPLPLKQRYPSFRDLKNGKISSMTVTANGMNGNVYTIPPNNYDKTQVKLSEQSDINQNPINQNNIYEHRLLSYGLHRNGSNSSLTAIRPTTLYNDDADSRLSDLEEDVNESNNWRLYSNEFSAHPNAKLPIHPMESHDVNRSLRDMNIFARPVIAIRQHNNGIVGNNSNYMKRTLTQSSSVAETNL